MFGMLARYVLLSLKQTKIQLILDSIYRVIVVLFLLYNQILN